MIGLVKRLNGHAWTIAPALRRMVWTAPSPGHRAAFDVLDERGLPLCLGGFLHVSPTQPGTLVLLVHGLGGSASSPYMADAAREAADIGYSVLRLSMRGVEDETPDIYHAGLTHDLHQVLAHPLLAEFHTILLVGISLGGHITLRAGCAPLDPRVKGIVALCSPVDLTRAIRTIDSPPAKVYREYVLRSLRAHHARMVAHRNGIAPQFRVEQIRKLREFDALVIAPRFGYSTPERYYHEESAAGVIEQLHLPALYIGSPYDPMVPLDTSRAALARAPRDLMTVRWLELGGHVYFPPAQTLGFPAARGLIPQILAWFEHL